MIQKLSTSCVIMIRNFIKPDLDHLQIEFDEWYRRATC